LCFKNVYSIFFTQKHTFFQGFLENSDVVTGVSKMLKSLKIAGLSYGSLALCS